MAKQLQDHPRLRGEQLNDEQSSGYTEGSPPLARGTVKLCFNVLIIAGITPACAGNSLCRSPPST